MADRLRLVRMDETGSPVLLSNLEDAPFGVWKLRDTFRVAPGSRNVLSQQGPGRYGGSRPVDDRLDNGTVTATWVITGSTSDLILQRVNAILTAAERGVPQGDTYIEWRPDGASQSTFFSVRGPATWNPTYSWPQFVGGKSIHVDVTWPVGPLAEGLRTWWWDDFRDRGFGVTDPMGDQGYHHGTWAFASIAQGSLRLPTTLTGQQGVVYNDARVSVPDMEVTVQGRTISGTRTALMPLEAGIKYLPSDGQYVYATLWPHPNGLDTYLVIDHWNGSAVVERAKSTAFMPSGFPAINSPYSIRIRSEGNYIFAEAWLVDPSPFGTPDLTCQVNNADTWGFGTNRKGHPVINVTPPTATADKIITRAEVQSYRYKWYGPNDYMINIPGTAPAKVDLDYMSNASAASLSPSFMLVTWRKKSDGVSGITGTNEVQRLSITGGPPTSGSFTLNMGSTFVGGSIPWNATASAVQSAIETIGQLPSGRGDVICTGGPLPGTPVTITFVNDSGSMDVPPLGAQSSTLSPAATPTFTTITPGVASSRIQTPFIDKPPDVQSGTQVPTFTPPSSLTSLVRSSSYLHWASAGSGAAVNSSVGWLVDPTIFQVDPFSEVSLVQVWGRLRWTAPPTAWTVTLSSYFAGTSAWGRQYSLEYGPTGLALPGAPIAGTTARWRLVMLGTLAIDPNSAQPITLEMNVASSEAAAADSFDMDYLMLGQARRAFSSPTGKPEDANYPQFMPWDATALNPRRIVYSDLSSSIMTAGGGSPAIQSPAGLGGSPFEPDPGDTYVTFLPGITVPADYNSAFGTVDEQSHLLASFAFAITPRYQLAVA